MYDLGLSVFCKDTREIIFLFGVLLSVKRKHGEHKRKRQKRQVISKKDLIRAFNMEEDSPYFGTKGIITLRLQSG